MAQKPKDMFTVVDRPRSNGHRVCILTADWAQDIEFFYPYYRLSEEGYMVDVLTPRGGQLWCEHGLKFPDTLPVAEAYADSYDLLYIPGGKAPSRLIRCEEAIDFVKEFVRLGRPVAALCHGPQVLMEAGAVRGRRIAAWPELEKDVLACGAVFANAPAVEDGQFITGRYPADLPMHLGATLKKLASGSGKREAA